MRSNICLLVAGSALIMSSAAVATPMSYTIQGTATGLFGGVAFTDAAYSITFFGDTTNITSSGGVYDLIATSNSLSVSGFTGTASFTDSIQTASNSNFSRAGFGDLTRNLAIVFVDNAGFSGYDLSTPIGPLSGSAVYNAHAAYATTLGDFEIDSTTTATFTAQGVPEPAGWSTLSLLFGGLLLSRKRLARK